MSHQILILIKSILRGAIVYLDVIDREPSIIPLRTLERLNNKSRKVREFVHNCMCSSTPQSSQMHFYIKVRKHKLKFKSSESLRKSILKSKSRTKRYCSLFSCNRVLYLYKNQTHITNYFKFKLSTGREKNPGPRPMFVNPNKTIATPYSQGNKLIFGQIKMRDDNVLWVRALWFIITSKELGLRKTSFEKWILEVNCIQQCFN